MYIAIQPKLAESTKWKNSLAHLINESLLVTSYFEHWETVVILTHVCKSLDKLFSPGKVSSDMIIVAMHCLLYFRYLSSDYLVLSEFTLALFEDSGRYKANYTALYDLPQNPLQWGKGIVLHNVLTKGFCCVYFSTE